MELKDGDKSKIIEELQNLPRGLEPGDVTDFIAISQHYSTATPYSYRSVSIFLKT